MSTLTDLELFTAFGPVRRLYSPPSFPGYYEGIFHVDTSTGHNGRIGTLKFFKILSENVLFRN